MAVELPMALQNLARGSSGELRFWLNGREVRITNPNPSVLLVDYLRDAGLTGTKEGCGQGGCGACTVMISQRTPEGVTHAPVNSCLRPLASVAGDHVSTTEGIGNPTEGLDAVQHRIALHNGTQCGFCTPGFVMNMHAYLRDHPTPSRQQVEDAFGGNLCRCTGYRPILDGMGTFAKDDTIPISKPCEVDPFFPLKLRSAPVPVEVPATKTQPLYFRARDTHWFRPSTLAEALELKRVASEELGREQVKPIVGNTASGIYPDETARCIIDISRVPELNGLKTAADGLHVGSAVSIQHLIEHAETLIAKWSAEETTGLRELVRHASFLAGLQVRSAGSVGGNIFITKSLTRGHHPFPSDLFTVLTALGTTLTVASSTYPTGTKKFELNDLPATQELPADSLFVEFHIPFTKKLEFVQTHRVARRPQMSHPIVNAGFRCQFDASGKVEEAVVVYGGLTNCNARLPKTEASLKGKAWNADTLKTSLAALDGEVAAFPQATDAEGFTGAYRSQLARGFFYKFFAHVAEQLKSGSVDAKNRSAAGHPDRPISRGSHQHLECDPGTPLTRPIAKRAGFSQAAGEIRYPIDEPLPPNGFQGVVIPSTRAHAKFKFSKSLPELEAAMQARFPGFVALVTADDIPGAKLIGLGGDDPILFDGVATCIGAPIALAVATTRITAEEVAKHVGAECVVYDDLPAILTLEDAIAKKSTLPPTSNMHPDPDGRHVVVTREGSNSEWIANPTAPLPGKTVLTGGLQTGAQAHFYMEPMCAMAVPGAYDQMQIYSSTQNPNGDQGQIARVLGVKANQITILLEQIGGGFGGKQNRAVFPAAIAAVAARKLRKPVRVAFDREQDMHYVGKRHPYRGEYHVAFSQDGTINGMKLDYCSDGGNTIDISFAVLKGSVMMSDGCYGIPTFQAGGTVFKTHKASNTAFRTFGQVQPHLIQEEAVERVAFELSKQLGRKVRAEEVRKKNMYNSAAFENAASTHFGQPIWFCELRERWDSLYNSSKFEERAKAVDEFNKNNRWRKRGISMTSLKYGIGFKQLAALNTSSALVQISKDDGSVTVVHGGVEMGQGLHTKIAQVAANGLGIGLEYIRVAGNNTDTIPNAAPTAASTGFDLNGGAVAAGCRVMRARLEEFCTKYEGDLKAAGITDWRKQWAECWPKMIVLAWLKRVPLISAELFAAPHYETPVQNFPRGKFFAYFAYGFSVSEVEIDVLTGEHTVLRADLLYDAGHSPNPAIDIGQVEGGYVQGLGFITTEEIIYDDTGQLVTDNIWSYKPPCSKSIPLDMRVALAEHDPASRAAQEKAGLLAVAASKSAAEPTLSLAVSAYFAIKQAIRAARAEQTGVEEWVRLDVPATCQRIQQACAVSPEKMTL
ncbi:MAG: xanthine dehydrogenase [Planctomycetaceae bacterium]|nr:xanthine dehydrogenase [Planctomycetaceae bacterium]